MAAVNLFYQCSQDEYCRSNSFLVLRPIFAQYCPKIRKWVIIGEFHKNADLAKLQLNLDFWNKIVFKVSFLIIMQSLVVLDDFKIGIFL